MKKDGIFKKLNKEIKRIRWTTAPETIKVFITTIIFIIIVTLILFGFTTIVVAIFDAIKS